MTEPSTTSPAPSTIATFMAGPGPSIALGPSATGCAGPAGGFGLFGPGETAADVAALKAGILALAPPIDAVEWGFPGTALHSYQCGTCYRRSLTAAAPCVPMACPPRTPLPPGTRCSSCGAELG